MFSSMKNFWNILLIFFTQFVFFYINDWKAPNISNGLVHIFLRKKISTGNFKVKKQHSLKGLIDCGKAELLNH